MMMRRILLALLLFVLLAPLPGSQMARVNAPPTNGFAMLALTSPAPGARFGALTLTEAWVMTSADRRFGGFSGMTLEGPRRFLLVSDAGYRLRFSLGSRGEVISHSFLDFLPLRRHLARKRFLDAEAITNDPVTGRYWVALEGIAHIWRHGADDQREGRHRNPAMFKWPANGGAESLARLPDRSFIALSERVVAKGMREGVLFSGDPVRPRSPYFTFYYDAGDLGAPTDIAALPDGRILILHRKLGLLPIFTSHIVLADPRGLRRGAVLRGRRIATIADRRLSENYEGIAIERGRDGLVLWLVSDDNQNDWQKSRLLRFRIDSAAISSAKRAVPLPGRP